MSELSPKHQAFVNAYLETRNAKQSYIAAGYSPNGAEVSASRLLKNAKVRHIIQEHQREHRESTWGNVEATLLDLQKIYERCMQIEEVKDRNGNPTGKFKFDSKGALRAKELIGRYLGIFDDPISVEVRNGFREIGPVDPDKQRETKLELIRELLNQRSTNAVQIEGSTGMDVRTQAENGTTVGQRDTELPDIAGLQEPTTIDVGHGT